MPRGRREAMTPYFAYGANLDRAGMARRCPRSRPRGTARLEDHRFLIMATGYATVVPAPGAVVHGILWDLANTDMPALDFFEEVDAGLYRKVALPVRLGADEVGALVYRGASTVRGVPCPGYMEMVLAAAAGWDLPAAYLSELRGWLAAS